VVSIEVVFGARIGSVIRGWIDKITEINRKYATPRIKMSRGVRLALLFLRLYLILLVVLLGYKFWTLLK
jgi:fluoride ion exporter CrcB/FEX